MIDTAGSLYARLGAVRLAGFAVREVRPESSAMFPQRLVLTDVLTGVPVWRRHYD